MFEFLLEIVGEFLVEVLFELATEALDALIDWEHEDRRITSAIGLVFTGAFAGLISAWLFPHRLLATRAVLPGLSLLLAPLATGSTMYFIGRRLRRVGRHASNLATFWGGAIFAFSMALLRWWLIGSPK